MEGCDEKDHDPSGYFSEGCLYLIHKDTLRTKGNGSLTEQEAQSCPAEM